MHEAVPETDALDITPGTNVLDYMRHQNLTWFDAIKEFIDNAIDKGATRIALIATKGTKSGLFRITDNGRGCPDLTLMIGLGKRDEDHDEVGRIGQYGVGAKDAMIWAADTVNISSVYEGMQRILSLDWDAQIRRRVWKLIRPPREIPTTDPPGTVVELHKLRHRRPDSPRLIEELSRTYLPWLRVTGNVLTLSTRANQEGAPIPPFMLPELLAQQTEKIDLDGKTVVVTLGLIPPGAAVKLRGVLCLYGMRVIAENKRLGIPAEALTHLVGWGEFSRGWSVEKNKRDFTEDLTDLEEAIATRFAGLISQALQRRVTQPQDAIKDQVNERLKFLQLKQGPLRKARRPGPHLKEGTIVPTGTGHKHTTAKETQRGNTFALQRFLSMEYAHLGVSGPRCQKTDDVLLINQDHPWFAEVMHHEALLTERIISVLSVQLGVEWHDPQLSLPWFDTTGSADRVFRIMEVLSGMALPRPKASRAAAD
jgi:hypothetical protein